MNWKDLPSLSALRAFAAYAETRSVQRAGDALNVSHAAISQQIRRLEAGFGVPLLDRSGRQMTLTDEGQHLARALADGFETIARGVEAISDSGDARPLQISTTPTFAAVWLMPRLARFRNLHPEISLMIDPSALVCEIRPGGIDAALRYGAGDWPGLEATLVQPSTVAIVAAPSLVGSADIKDPSDLRCYTWIHELGTNEGTDWLNRNAGGSEGTASILSMPGNLVLEAARQGQGIAITSRLAVEAEVASGRLRLLFEEDRHKGYYLVTAKGVPRPALRHFMRWIKREANSTEQVNPDPS